jgi:hypothetical protein
VISSQYYISVDRKGRGLTDSKRTLEGDIVLLHTLDGFVGDSGLSVLQDGCDVDGLPLDGGLQLT